MLLSHKSQISGKINTMDLDVTKEQLDKFNAGAYIQDVFPHLTAGEREFILTGVTPEEWDAVMGSEDDDENDFGEANK